MLKVLGWPNTGTGYMQVVTGIDRHRIGKGHRSGVLPAAEVYGRPPQVKHIQRSPLCSSCGSFPDNPEAVRQSCLTYAAAAFGDTVSPANHEEISLTVHDGVCGR